MRRSEKKTQLADESQAELTVLQEKYENAERTLKSLNLRKQGTNSLQAVLT